MAIATLAQLKQRLGVPTADTSQDDALTALLAQAQALAEKHVGYPFEQTAAVTEYHAGTGREYLSLRRVPVTFVQPTGTVASGSTAVTGLSSASRLVAGMPVVAPDYLPAGTVLSSVNAGALTAVLSRAATASGSGVRLSCGCAAWLDQGAEAGQGEDDFPEDTALEPGTDYSLRPTSGPAGLFASGLLRRPGGVWPRHARRTSGWLHAAVPGPLSADQTIKVVYTAGWAAADIPADLAWAVLDVCALAFRGRVAGGVVSSVSFDGLSFSLDSGRLMDAWMGWLAGGGGAILARYRRTPV